MERHPNGRYGKYAVMAETLWRMGEEQRRRREKERRKQRRRQALRRLMFWRAK